MSTTSTTPRKSGPLSETTATRIKDIDQKAQKARLNIILRGHTWQFPPDDIARMLSPKILKEQYRNKPRDSVRGIHHELNHFDTLIEQPSVAKVMNTTFTSDRIPFAPNFVPAEEENYEPIVVFLNNCVDLCNIAYDKIYKQRKNGPFTVVSRTKRWWKALQFAEYHKPTGDKVKNAKGALAPDFVGLQFEGTPPDDLISYWCLPMDEEDPSAVEIAMPGESKPYWKDCVLQGATYARAVFTAAPLRTFTLVIGVNHRRKSLRVLIFHHGGLSASHELILATEGKEEGVDERVDENVIAFLKMLLSILLWQKPVDAGLPEFTDGETWVLPSKGATKVAKQKAVLHHHPSIRSRETFVALLEAQLKEVALLSNTGRPIPQAPSGVFDFDAVTSTLPAVAGRTRSSKASLASSSKQTAEKSGTVETANDDIPTIYAEKVIYDKERFDLKFFDHELTRAKRNYQEIPAGNIIVKCSWPSFRKNGVEADMYEACRDDFGTAVLLASYEPFTSGHHCVTNVFYLPPFGSDLSQYFWKFAERDDKCVVASEPDYRNMVVTLLRDEGETFDYCTSAWDLCESLLHSMLGWLSVYQSGYMQRDVSIGNLLKLKKPVDKASFTIGKLEEFRDAVLCNSRPIKEGLRRVIVEDKVGRLKKLKLEHPAKFTEQIEELVLNASKLKSAVEALGVSGECKAIISDGDLATYIPSYFSQSHDAGTLSGTPEFMSPGLVLATDSRDAYLHTPMDDMYSFFYVALWVTLLHPKAEGKTEKEHVWRGRLRNGKRDLVIQDFRRLVDDDEMANYSPLLRGMLLVLQDWYPAIEKLDLELRRSLVNKNDNIQRNPLLCFDRFAFRGVKAFVDVLTQHRASVQSSSFRF